MTDPNDGLRTPKPVFGRSEAPVRTWASSAPAGPLAKRSNRVALSVAGGVGLLSLYGMLAPANCSRTPDFAKAEAERGRVLTPQERQGLIDQAQREERECRGSRRSGSGYSRSRGRSWFSSAGSASGPVATTRGGFGRSGFSFGG